MNEDKLMFETNNVDFKLKAIEKLNNEMSSSSDNNYTKPIIKYLIERCNEDEGLAEDICQKHKTWKKCFDFIKEQARKLAKDNCCVVSNDTVYEWAEDYYHKDDKAEEEQKAKEKAERERVSKERTDKVKTNSKKADVVQKKNVNNAKPKKMPKSDNIEGQTSLFDFMDFM